MKKNSGVFNRAQIKSERSSSEEPVWSSKSFFSASVGNRLRILRKTISACLRESETERTFLKRSESGLVRTSVESRSSIPLTGERIRPGWMPRRQKSLGLPEFSKQMARGSRLRKFGGTGQNKAGLLFALAGGYADPLPRRGCRSVDSVNQYALACFGIKQPVFPVVLLIDEFQSGLPVEYVEQAGRSGLSVTEWVLDHEGDEGIPDLLGRHSS